MKRAVRLAMLLPVVALLAACASPASAPGPGAAAPAARASLVGAPAPAFSLYDAAGRPVTLEYYRGQRHIVLVFYIGNT